MSPTPDFARSLIGVIAAAVATALAALALLQPPPAGRPGGGLSDSRDSPLLAPCIMDRPGFLKGDLFGDVTLAMDWHGAELGCDGNRRPDDTGLRLFFSGRPAGSRSGLVLVLGIDADLPTLTLAEHAVAVTLIDESGSRFYHAGKDRCWTQVREVSALPGESNYRINGQLYCAGAIPAVSEPGSVTLGDINYSGRLHDATP